MQTFSNASAIVINEIGIATPFPSSINVSGLGDLAEVVKVRVTLHGLTHRRPSDLSVWLLAPDGSSALLLAKPLTGEIANATIGFDDCAPGILPRFGAPAVGRSRPTVRPGLPFSALPRPTLSTPFPVLTLSALAGPAPLYNGAWTLYVQDHSAQLGGVIAGGWSLTLYTQPERVVTGRITRNVAAPACGKPDYDGDGRSDVAVYRPTTGEWFVFQSSTQTGTVINWGAPAASGLGDIAVPGDYDGDGQTDVAVYRDTTGTWYLRFSSGGTAALPFGTPSSFGLRDQPVPGDYDGDAITDLAIYRESTGEWFTRQSDGNAEITIRTWGAPSFGDYPARR